MKLLRPPGRPHLSYCTNIHAGESLRDVSESLRQFVPAIRGHLEDAALLPPDAPFGLGLRLSAEAAAELRRGETLQQFASLLAGLGAYVFTVNAFPWGNFHRKPVKQAVYQPDWESAERVAYTLDCAQALSGLLPPGGSGSISTVPLGYRDGRNEEERIAAMLPRLSACVARLADIERRGRKRIVLGLEPEPGCLLENTADALRFFEQAWLAPDNLAYLADLCRVGVDEAAGLARRHLGICYDICHAAVEFEDPVGNLSALLAHGVTVAKIQISSALRIPAMSASIAPFLQRFDDGIYLHQVVRNDGRRLQRESDLAPALQSGAANWDGEEWRIHCHVPLFWRGDGEIGGTWEQCQSVLQALMERELSPHLEIETYTWDVLPDALRTADKAGAIARELQTVMQLLGEATS